MMSPTTRCVIFDFANTLSHTPYFWPLGPEFLTIVTEGIFAGDNKALWASPWCRGEISSEDIAKRLSGLSGLTPQRILKGLNEGCANLQLNPAVWRFAQAQRSQGRHAVLATVNMDVFTRIVAPAHGFNRVVDLVVNSSDHGTDDKMTLCEIALRQLDGCTFEDSLLIDDSAGATDAFRERGGTVYHYTSDEAFAKWLETLSSERIVFENESRHESVQTTAAG